MSAAHVAGGLGVTPDTVTRWCREGRIPAVKPGRDWRIPASVVDDLLAERPPSLWTTALERQLRELRPPDHVLVLVPGGSAEARRVLKALAAARTGPVLVAPEPPPAPSGGHLARATLVAGARAAWEAEAELAGGGHEAPRWLVRWVTRLPGGLVASERRMQAVASRCVVFCLQALEGEPELAPLIDLHTHVLVAAAHGRSWLGRSEARSAAVGP